MAELDALQARVAEMIRGTTAIDGRLCRGNSFLDGRAQLAVYAEQFTLRMHDALREDLPATTHALGDDAAATFDAYLADHPPDSWTLAALPTRFPAWLAHRGAAAHLVDLAALDVAVHRGFTAEARAPITEADLPRILSGDLKLSLQPSLSLLRPTLDVHRYRADVAAGTPPGPLQPGDFPLVVFRASDLGMRHLVIEPGAYAILDSLGKDGRLDAAIDAAVAAAGAEAVAPKLATWFQDFAARRWLVQRSTEGTADTAPDDPGPPPGHPA